MKHIAVRGPRAAISSLTLHDPTKYVKRTTIVRKTVPKATNVTSVNHPNTQMITWNEHMVPTKIRARRRADTDVVLRNARAFDATCTHVTATKRVLIANRGSMNE